MRFRKDLFYLFLLFALAIIFWWPALLPGKAFFFWDLANEIIPKRHFFAKSCGITLWCPYIFMGTPYAANPQSEAWYPLNFIFCLFGAERGLVFYIVLHHIFFMLTFYGALRRMGSSAEASLIGAIAGGFGGYMMSLTLFVVLLSTLAWMPLLMIALNEALNKNWLRWSLLSGLALTFQFLAGEFEIAAMSLLFAALAVFFSQNRGLRDLAKLAGIIALALVWGIVLSLPQLMLTWEMIPLSNRHQGMDIAKALVWSVEIPNLKNLVIPNYYLPYSAGVYSYLGKFTLQGYFESLYLGSSLAAVAVFGLFNRKNLRVWFWFLVVAFGLVMMLGNQFPAPVYEFFHTHLPGMKFFRIPAKFFFFLNFGFVMLVVYGFESIASRKWSLPWVSAVLIIAGLAVGGLLAANPVKVAELGDKYVEVIRYFNIRGVMRASACFLVSLGLVFMAGVLKRNFLGIAFALLVFADFFFANLYLNPAAGMDFYEPSPRIRELKEKEKNRVEPVRFFSVFNPGEYQPKTFASRFFLAEKDREYFCNTWAVYYDLNNLRGEMTFYPLDINRYKAVIAGAKWPLNELVLARSGVEYIYHPDYGFRKLAGVFSRARVFYRSQTVDNQRRAINLWASQDFNAFQTLLLENTGAVPDRGQVLMMSEPARIVQYENEKVVIEAEARQDGWLLLLDAYYPGWKAELDGSPVEIYRANGFFRAVRIPAGKHTVTFRYFPDIFRKSLYVSGAGFSVWLFLLVWSARNKRRRV